MERFKAQGTQSATETCNDNYTKPNTELFDAYLPEYDSTYLDEPANQNYNLIEALKRIHIITYLRSILEQLYSQAKKIALEKARQKYIGACLTISFSQKISLLVITIAISFCHFILGHQKFITCFILILNFLYLITIVYKSILFIIGNKISKNSKTKEPLSKNNKKIDAILPIYTILLPLYKEKSIVSKLLQNIQNINYPKNKLQVLLI